MLNIGISAQHPLFLAPDWPITRARSEQAMMKLCPKCDHSPLPFLMTFVIAAVCGFVTWLTLGLTIADTLTRAAISAAAFVVVGATILHYVLSCMRRHCRHHDVHESRLATLRLPKRRDAAEPPDTRLGEAPA